MQKNNIKKVQMFVLLGLGIAVAFVLVFKFNHRNKKHNEFFEEFIESVFETDRLSVRLSTEQDFDILSEYLMDKKVTSQLDPLVKEGFADKNAATDFLKDSMKENGHYNFTVFIRESNIPIGQVSYICIENLMMVSYWLSSEYQGKGYASEISLPLTRKVFESCKDIKTLYIACDYNNVASAKLAEKILMYVNKNKEYVYEYNEKTASDFHYKEFMLLKK